MRRARRVVYETLETYDSISRGYAHWRGRPWRLVELLRGGVTLDLGSGHCVNGIHVALKRPGGYLICLDLAPSMLRETRAAFKRRGLVLADAIAADATAIPLRDSSVDSVLSVAMVHHLPRVEANEAFREIARVLRPRGIALVTSWSGRQLRFLLPTLAAYLRRALGIPGPGGLNVPWRTKGGVYTRRYFPHEADDLARLSREVGLRVLSCGYVSRSRSLNSYVVSAKV